MLCYDRGSMKNINRIFVVFLSFVLCFFSISCDSVEKNPIEHEYMEMQTDIDVSVGKASSVVDREGYSLTAIRLTVSIEGKKGFADSLNAVLDEWLRDGMAECDRYVESRGEGDREYSVVNYATFNRNGLLSLRCALECYEYGESISYTLNSAVYDVGRETEITLSDMLRMGEVDLENMLTINVYPEVSKYADRYPAIIVNGAGRYSEYMGYYVNDGGLSLYLSYDNMDYYLGYMEFVISFIGDPEGFNYDLSVE